MSPDAEAYLAPYLRAAKLHRATFASLLWNSPASQRARFEAILRVCQLANRTVLDAGCGRADLLDFLLARRVPIAHYVGIEAVPALARAARRKKQPLSLIIEADFVRQPARLLVGADVVVLCGSLNTFDTATFFTTIRRAYEACGQTLVFNFLCSPVLAAADWLNWHRASDVLAFARTLTKEVKSVSDYVDGDCTMALGRR